MFPRLCPLFVAETFAFAVAFFLLNSILLNSVLVSADDAELEAEPSEVATLIPQSPEGKIVLLFDPKSTYNYYEIGFLSSGAGIRKCFKNKRWYTLISCSESSTALSYKYHPWYILEMSFCGTCLCL
jgi:hypothetical protein